jgi:hypothetical protein
VTQAADDVAASASGRQQVLLGPMRKLTADLVRQAIGDLVLEFESEGSALRPAGSGPPPVVIVALETAQARNWVRDLLQARPEAIVLQVERDDRELSVRALYPSHDFLGTFNAQRLVNAIATAPTWSERFDGR